MGYQAADVKFAESLLEVIIKGVKETFDIFAGGTGQYNKRISFLF